MAPPAVSIVVPTWNRADLLAETIASVLAQTLPAFELLVVDDESSDGTRDLVQGIDDRRVVYLPMRRCGNLSILRNAGIKASRGRFVAFLDSDDLWREDKLAVQAALLSAHVEAGFAFSGYDTFTAAGVERTKLYRDDGTPSSVRSVFDDLIRGKMVIFSSTALIRRELFDQVGLLNEELRTGDYELFTRLAWASKAGIVHAPLVKVRRHEGNTSQRLNAEGLEEAIFSVRRFHALGAITKDVRDDRLLKYQSDLAYVLFSRGDRAGARKALLECIRLRPGRLEYWRAYGRFLARSTVDAVHLPQPILPPASAADCRLRGAWSRLPSMPSSTVENYVKRLYMEQQRSPDRLVPMGRLAAVMGVVPGTVTTMVKALDEERLVHYEPRSGVRLTRSGERLALRVLRRHRLVELFLVKILGFDWSEVHEEAEVLEHAVSEKVLERMDELLDHPTADPHGDPIPDAAGAVVHRRVQTLADCAAGQQVQVARVESEDAQFLKFADEHGLVPDSLVVVESHDAAADAVTLRAAGHPPVVVSVRAARRIHAAVPS